MIRSLSLSILLTLVIGCASQANLELNLDTWKGHHVNGLIESWGAPSTINNAPNGVAHYSWLFDTGVANSAIDGTIKEDIFYCKVTISVSTENTIETWALEGNDCKV